MLFDKKLSKALGYASDYITEDITSRMKHLIAQINKLLKTGPNSPVHKYAQRAGIDLDPVQIIMSLADFDPTGNNGMYMPWIIRIVGQGMNLPEDGSSLYGALEKFHRIKRSPRFKGPTDIMQIRNFSELLKHVSSGESKTRAKMNISGWTQYIEEFYSTDFYRVIRFDPRPYVGKEIKIVATAERENKAGDIRPINWILQVDATPEQLQWAKEKTGEDSSSWRVEYITEINPAAVPMMEISAKAGTVWCVAAPNYAKQYLEEGPVHFFYKKDGGNDELFSCADVNFNFTEGGWVDIDNNSLMKMSEKYAMLLCKMITLGEQGELEKFRPQALKNIGALLKRLVRQAKNNQLPPKWYVDRQLDSGEVMSAADFLIRGFEITQGA